jgi:hypothetical protein
VGDVVAYDDSAETIAKAKAGIPTADLRKLDGQNRGSGVAPGVPLSSSGAAVGGCAKRRSRSDR